MSSGGNDFEQRVEPGCLWNQGPVSVWRVRGPSPKDMGQPRDDPAGSRQRALNGSTQVGREGSWVPSPNFSSRASGSRSLAKAKEKVQLCSPGASSGSLPRLWQEVALPVANGCLKNDAWRTNRLG